MSAECARSEISWGELPPTPAAPRPLNFPWEAPGPQAGSASLVAPPAPEGYYPGQGVTATGVFTLA